MFSDEPSYLLHSSAFELSDPSLYTETGFTAAKLYNGQWAPDRSDWSSQPNVLDPWDECYYIEASLNADANASLDMDRVPQNTAPAKDRPAVEKPDRKGKRKACATQNEDTTKEEPQHSSHKDVDGRRADFKSSNRAAKRVKCIATQHADTTNEGLDTAQAPFLKPSTDSELPLTLSRNSQKSSASQPKKPWATFLQGINVLRSGSPSRDETARDTLVASETVLDEAGKVSSDCKVDDYAPQYPVQEEQPTSKNSKEAMKSLNEPSAAYEVTDASALDQLPTPENTISPADSTTSSSSSSSFKKGAIEDIYCENGRTPCLWGDSCTHTFHHNDADLIVRRHILNDHKAEATFPAEVASSSNAEPQKKRYMCRWRVNGHACGARAGTEKDKKGLIRHILEVHLGRKRVQNREGKTAVVADAQ